MNQKNYHVQLKGEGINVDRAIDEETARRIISIILTDNTNSYLRRISTDPPHRHNVNIESEPKEATNRILPNEKTSPTEYTAPKINNNFTTSIREYLDEVKAKNNAQMILAFACYLMDRQKLEEFEPESLKNLFKMAGEKMPANYSRDFKTVIKNGWVTENFQSPGKYYLTQKGQLALKQQFSYPQE